MSYPTQEQIKAADTSEEFLQLMQAHAPDTPVSKIHEFQEHMVNAALMSHFKYGWVKDKSYTHYKKLGTFEGFGFAKDKNLEHQVNIANYAMFRYITGPAQPAVPEVETPEDLIQIAVEALHRYVNPQEGEHYTGTDSDKSVVKAKPKQVRAHLYDRFASAYDFSTPQGPDHFIW